MPAEAVKVGEGATAVDPVCGMTVAVTPATRSMSYADQTFHFCSDKCLTKFKANPWFYASGNAAKREKVAAVGVQYTCPMHRQIVRVAPGSCPICDMALEPILPSDAPSEELTDFTRRMWISAAAAVPLAVLTMGPLVGLPLRDWMGHHHAMYLEFLLATPIILWAAWPFFRRGRASMLNRSPNMWALISLGVGGCLRVFAAGNIPARRVPGGVQHGRNGRHLLRGGGGDRDAGVCR